MSYFIMNMLISVIIIIVVAIVALVFSGKYEKKDNAKASLKYTIPFFMAVSLIDAFNSHVYTSELREDSFYINVVMLFSLAAFYAHTRGEKQ